eukprot:8951470-Pyramimonas_sp.AAC.1
MPSSWPRMQEPELRSRTALKVHLDDFSTGVCSPMPSSATAPASAVRAVHRQGAGHRGHA